MTPILHVEMQVTRCDARFLVNDIPVGTLRHRLSGYQALPIHEYLVQGQNTLRIERLDAPPLPAPGDEPAAPDPDGPPGARLSVAGYEVGMTPGQDKGRVTSLLEFKSLNASGQAVNAADGRFDLANWPMRWSWQALTVLDWQSPQARRAVFQFLQVFGQHFKAGDASAIGAALLPKMTDYCQAYGLNLRAEIAELNGRMARRAADPSFEMLPLAEVDLVLRPCAGGRLVDCLVASGEPAIRWKDARVGNRGAIALRLGSAAQRLLVYR